MAGFAGILPQHLQLKVLAMLDDKVRTQCAPSMLLHKQRFWVGEIEGCREDLRRNGVRAGFPPPHAAGSLIRPPADVTWPSLLDVKLQSQASQFFGSEELQ